ncbi:rna polymerase i specific transcription initiation factor [Diplodia corticola]|uniref:Rna polymerase i specific transcription initiation factor n=1 Tax=Diplodia corticola TaxID=236234 RepID=A0A1J9QXA1_9PEZI|nr:rna polymerase i specific transcription initiation factor [Diplodia corticola]OJD33654.1 rna polymerase i specific transcription initiation factor [Diplodia corticola]
MSLFGGPLPPESPANPRDESPYFRSSSLPLPSSPPPVPDPDNDELVSSVERDPSTDGHAPEAGDDEESGSEYTSSDSESDRPRFHGKWQTYRRYIQEERDLTESLVKLRAEDLSLHLYDVHALKRRLLSEQAARKAENEKTGVADEGDDDDEQWKPGRMWTAWPLEPEQVPRPYERFTILPTIDPDEEHTVRRPGHERQRPIRDIKEILVGLVQKKAREKWDRKEWEDDTEPEAGEAGPASRGSSHEGSMEIDGQAPNRGASASRAATPTGFRREFILDDDKAYEALGPTTRSIVSKLNVVLMAVHERNRSRGRSTTSRKGANTATDTEASRSRSTKRRKKNQSASEGEAKVKRGRGRPPKSASQTPGPDSTPYVTEGEETSASAKKRGRGRPKKWERLPGESYYMVRKRLAQLAADGQLPDAAAGSNPPSRAQTTEPEPDSSRPPTPNNPSASAANLLARPRSDSTSSEDSDDNRPRKPSGGKAPPLKDWRDVLGKASSLGGFSDAVIARATRRCAELFGENATVRTADSGGAVEEPAEETQAEPVVVEDVGEGPSVRRLPQAKTEDDRDPATEPDAHRRQSHPLPSDIDPVDDDEERDEHDRPFWDSSSLTCPHPDCDRHTEPYEKLWRLREHVKKKHKYTLNAPRINAKGSKKKARRTKKNKEKTEEESKGKEKEKNNGKGNEKDDTKGKKRKSATSQKRE